MLLIGLPPIATSWHCSHSGLGLTSTSLIATAIKRGTNSGAPFVTIRSKPSAVLNCCCALYHSGLVNCCPKIPAISRATPNCPKQSGRCVNILFSISSTKSSKPNVSAKLAPARSSAPLGRSFSVISIIPL